MTLPFVPYDPNASESPASYWLATQLVYNDCSVNGSIVDPECSDLAVSPPIVTPISAHTVAVEPACTVTTVACLSCPRGETQ